MRLPLTTVAWMALFSLLSRSKHTGLLPRFHALCCVRVLTDDQKASSELTEPGARSPRSPLEGD